MTNVATLSALLACGHTLGQAPTSCLAQSGPKSCVQIWLASTQARVSPRYEWDRFQLRYFCSTKRQNHGSKENKSKLQLPILAGVVSQNGAMFQVQTFDADTNQLRTEVARKFGLDVFCERVEPC